MAKNVMICGARSAVGYNLLLALLKREDIGNIWLVDEEMYHLTSDFHKADFDLYDMYNGFIISESDYALFKDNNDRVVYPKTVVGWYTMIDNILKRNNIRIVYDLMENTNPDSTFDELIRTNIECHTRLYQLITQNQRSPVTKVITLARNNDNTWVNNFFDFTLKYKIDFTKSMNFGNNIYTMIRVPNILDINSEPYDYGNLWMQVLYAIKYNTSNIHYRSRDEIINGMHFCKMEDVIKLLMSCTDKNYRNNIYVDCYVSKGIGSKFINASLIQYLMKKYNKGLVFLGNTNNEEIYTYLNMKYNYRNGIYRELGRIAKEFLEVDNG
jgi:hypothetical protein